MKKLLLVIDMQNDFVSGSLGSPQAQAIVPAVKAKVEQFRKNKDKIVFSRDTHDESYLQTQEGKYLPVCHCIRGTFGQAIVQELDSTGCTVIDKPTFGSLALAEQVAQMAFDADEIELCGLCTDICVVSNALILKARLPEITVTVDAACCAGTSEGSHKAALLTMKMCQVQVVNE